jgi:hypothetical protein
MKEELEIMNNLYYIDKKYDEVFERSQYILDHNVEDLDTIMKYPKKKRNEILMWLPSVQHFNIRALIRLDQYYEAINAIKNSIEFNKHLVDYFHGFFSSEEVLIYMLYYALNDTVEVEKLRNDFLQSGALSEKQLESIEEDAKKRVFYFGY